jgi:uncharacterized protein DUF998
MRRQWRTEATAAHSDGPRLVPSREAIGKGAPMEHSSEPTPISRGPALALSGLENGFLSPRTLGLVSCGGIGALLFTATYLIEGFTRPGYDAWSQPISALSLGPGGWAQRVNFVVYGLLLALSAVGWYGVLSPGRGSIWFPLLQGISGLCLIGAGFFSMDPLPGYPPGAALASSTAHGTLHSIFAWTLILTLAQGCFTLAAHFWRTPHWRGWAVYSWITGALILIFWGMFVQYATGPLAGLVERLSAGSHDLWLCALTTTLVIQYWRRRRSSADSAGPAAQ